MFQKKEYVAKSNLTAEVTTSERLNTRTGDVDQKLEINFFDKAARQIGWARITKRGEHGIKAIGDVALAEYFGLTAEA